MDVRGCALCLTALDTDRLHVQSKFCRDCHKALSRMMVSERSDFIDCSAGAIQRERIRQIARNSKRGYDRPRYV